MEFKSELLRCYRLKITLITLALLLLFPSLIFPSSDHSSEDIKRFIACKKHFYALMYPIILEENQKILNLRSDIRTAIKNEDMAFIRKIKKQYKLQPGDSTDKLLKRVDIIPLELVLAQSALESNWGRSRFAKEGNNMFGQWCYPKGCGMVPQRRNHGQTHEVAVYPTINASVRSYLKNVNTNSAHKKFRDIRLRLRKQEKPLDALLLAEGLDRYSQQGLAYIKSIQKMVRTNKPLLAEVSR